MATPGIYTMKRSGSQTCGSRSCSTSSNPNLGARTPPSSVTADHGEGFGERVGGVDKYRIWKHAFELYEVLVKVPLFVYVPGVEAREVPRWRSQIDLVPTIYDLLGVKAPEGLFGQSWVPEIYGAEQPPRPIVVDLPADSYNRRRRALIEDGYKLIAFGKDFRYNAIQRERRPHRVPRAFPGGAKQKEDLG